MRLRSIRGNQMSLAIKAVKLAQQFTTGNVASTFFNVFQGRCTFAAICFSTTGVYGWLHGKDLTSYALFVTAVQGLLVLHSWKSDIHDQRMARVEMDRVKVNLTSDLENGDAHIKAGA